MVGICRLLRARPRQMASPGRWTVGQHRMGRRWPARRGRVRTTRLTTDASVHAIPRATRGESELEAARLGQCSEMTPELRPGLVASASDFEELEEEEPGHY